MVFGTFDELHPGHLYFLRQAKRMGDELYVVVARDQTVKEIKGHAPRQPEDVRRSQLDLVAGVRRAVLGSRDDPFAVIRRYRPQIICLGYDQTAFTSELPKRFPGIRIQRIAAFHPERYKTSRRHGQSMSADDAERLQRGGLRK